jgi:hypothetical protein
MSMNPVSIDWEKEARKIVEAEIKFLEVFYPGLPKTTVIYDSNIDKDTITNADGSVYLGLTCGRYTYKSKCISIFYRAISQLVKENYEDFKRKIMGTLAHEFMHHWQFNGDRQLYYAKSIKKDRENETCYRDKEIEVQAREAAEWFIERRQPIVLKLRC